MKKSLKIKDCWSILAGIFIILTSGHAFQSIYLSVGTISIVVGFFLILPVLYSFFNEPIKLQTLAVLCFLLMVFLTLVAHFGEELKFYLKIISCVVSAYFISSKISFEKFVKYYLNFMTITTLLAIVCYYLLNYTSLLAFFPKVNNLNDVEFGIGVIYNYITHLPHRNCGMFWEPGIFATNIIIAIVFEMLYKTAKISWFRMLIFAWGIITANSSAGFLLLFLCVTLYVMRSNKNSNNALFNVLKVFLIAFSIFIILNLETILSKIAVIDNPYIQKLFIDNVTESSRYKALEHNIRIFLTAPVFGAGVAYVNANMMYVADTSSFTYILSVFGILAISYAVFWFISIFKQKKINIFARIMLFIIFAIILNKEPQHSLLLSWCILFYFLRDENKQSKEGALNDKKT